MIRVLDDVLRDPMDYRARALAQQFGDVAIAGDTFKGIAPAPDLSLPLEIKARLPKLEPTLTFLRKSPAGQTEPNLIHSDEDMGRWTGIFYLNPEPAEGDGTTFWRRPNGDTDGHWTPEVAAEARDLRGWAPWHRVAARFNRLLLFTSDLFHSRALPQNYGEGDGARLIQVVFGLGGPA